MPRTQTFSPSELLIVRAQKFLYATGATDRVLPIPGWTLPGVYTLGGAQIALKYQGCVIGHRNVFLGTGPLLYLVAYQYGVLDWARVHAIASERLVDLLDFCDRLADRADNRCFDAL